MKGKIIDWEKFQQKVKRSIDFLLKEDWFPHWWTDKRDEFFISHDDCDGDQEEGLRILTYASGDVVLSVESSRRRRTLRFRTHTGGGRYLKVRNAVLILMEAIRQTEEDAT
jgi:hypothetical protein